MVVGIIGTGEAIPPGAGAALYMSIGSSVSVPPLRLPSRAVVVVGVAQEGGMEESKGSGGDTEDATDVAADLGLIVSSSSSSPPPLPAPPLPPSVDPNLRRRTALVVADVATAFAVAAWPVGFNLLRISGAPSRKACEVFSCAR
jgi:hypothetical protein